MFTEYGHLIKRVFESQGQDATLAVAHFAALGGAGFMAAYTASGASTADMTDALAYGDQIAARQLRYALMETSGEWFERWLEIKRAVKM